MAGKIITNWVALGDHATDSNNFVLKTNVDGTATFARGAAGNLGTVFGVNANNTITGLTAAAMPAGSVLQVVQGSTAITVSNSTTTYVDTGLTATITPKFATSKILVTVFFGDCLKTGAAVSLVSQLLRGVTVVAPLSTDGGYTPLAGSSVFSLSGSYYDSPATTSATTYKTQFKSNTAAAAVSVQQGSLPSTITLMEIAG